MLTLNQARTVFRSRNLDVPRFEIVNVIGSASRGATFYVVWWDGSRTDHYLTSEEIQRGLR